MRKFLIKTTAYISTIIIIIVLMSSLSILIVSEVSFKLDENKNILVLGASSTECAINDTILTNYLNLSQSAEALIFTYVKLNEILKTNMNIDTVLLAYSYDILLEGRDEWIMGEIKMKDNISRYISFFNFDELKIFIPELSFWSTIVDLPYLNKKAIVSYLANKHDFSYTELRLGRYQYLIRDRLSVDIARRNEQTTLNLNEYTHYSKYQNEYLLKIIKLCKNYNVKLILINTPMYTSAISNFAINQFYQYHALHYLDIPFIDCSSFVLDDSCYADVKHLNYKGAKVFSEFIKENGLVKLSSLYSYESNNDFNNVVVK